MAFKIKTVTVFVAIDENNEEGVMGFKSDMGWMPLVCADEERIRKVFPIAEQIKKASGKDYRVLQFSVRTDVTDEIKKKYSK